MSDDWSLKGKKESYTFPDALYSEEKYKAEDIETLRQKLIEDFMVYALKHNITCTAEFYEIINKRFGVE